jgi:lipid-A-disaccharide synthase
MRPSLRVFVSAGEPSGEMLATKLLDAMRAQGVDLTVDGIGGERLERAGVTIVQRNDGWASLGPIEALGKIPRLLAIAFAMAARLRNQRYDLIVAVDFGAFNLRLIELARTAGVSTPVLYYVPPGAWLDDARRARRVAAVSDPLTPFAHQRDFYRGLGLPIGWVGHPLVSTIAPRSARAAAPADGGVIALLPGSRPGELHRHVALLVDAFTIVRHRRRNATALIAASDPEAAGFIERDLALRTPIPVELVDGAPAAFARCDVAAIASGTAVLEAALAEVPTVAFYVLSEAQARIARRVFRGPLYTLPNLVLGERAVPELMQEEATPMQIADALDHALAHPDEQRDAQRRLRAALGPPDALERCARFALSLAER